MCWACEQDRFWAAYAEYMAAKEARNELPTAADGADARGLVIPPPCGEGGDARSAEPGGGQHGGE